MCKVYVSTHLYSPLILSPMSFGKSCLSLLFETVLLGLQGHHTLLVFLLPL